jgi:hypothetical protein
MKILVSVFLLSIIGLSISAQEKKATISDVSWISGCWQMNDNGKITTERWSKATSNVIIGVSQTVKDGKTVAFEFLRIIDNGHGAIYVAKPSNAKDETGFFAKKFSANEVVFENTKHDFPQRIIYRLQDKESLIARIEGKQGDKEMGIDFPMTRIKCE